MPILVIIFTHISKIIRAIVSDCSSLQKWLKVKKPYFFWATHPLIDISQSDEHTGERSNTHFLCRQVFIKNDIIVPLRIKVADRSDFFKALLHV